MKIEKKYIIIGLFFLIYLENLGYYLFDNNFLFVFYCRRSWQPLDTVTSLTLLADSLTEGNSYLFRVTAINEYGSSEPVELSTPVTIESTIGMYTLSLVYVHGYILQHTKYSSS